MDVSGQRGAETELQEHRCRQHPPLSNQPPLLRKSREEERQEEEEEQEQREEKEQREEEEQKEEVYFRLRLTLSWLIVSIHTSSSLRTRHADATPCLDAKIREKRQNICLVLKLLIGFFRCFLFCFFFAYNRTISVLVQLFHRGLI